MLFAYIFMLLKQVLPDILNNSEKIDAAGTA